MKKKIKHLMQLILNNKNYVEYYQIIIFNITVHTAHEYYRIII